MAVKATGQITLALAVDVKAVYRYYLLQSSTAAKPSAPTVHPPAGDWGDSEPTYKEGDTSSLYTVDCTVFRDDTFSYTPVSLSSSYEAAKLAYNKAILAQQMGAQSVKDVKRYYCLSADAPEKPTEYPPRGGDGTYTFTGEEETFSGEIYTFARVDGVDEDMLRGMVTLKIREGSNLREDLQVPQLYYNNDGVRSYAMSYDNGNGVYGTYMVAVVTDVDNVSLGDQYLVPRAGVWLYRNMGGLQVIESFTFHNATALTWDGDTTGLESVMDMYYKVSTEVPANISLVGESFTLTVQGENPAIQALPISEDLVMDASQDQDGSLMCIHDSGTPIVMIVSKDQTLEGIGQLTTGVYFFRMVIDADIGYISAVSGLISATGWSETEPAPESGKSLYSTVCTVLNDGTFNYSDVSLSSALDVADKVQQDLANNYLTTVQTKEEITKESGVIRTTVSKEIVEKVNAVEVGGRNLFGFKKNVLFYELNPDVSTLTPDLENNGFYITIIAEPTPGTILGRISRLGFNGTGTESYTFSSIVSSTQSCSVSLDICDKVNAEHSLTTDEQKISFTATPTAYYDSISSDYNGFFDVTAKGSIPVGTVIYFKNVKIERGNKATDWTPAPEDVQSGLDTAQDSAGKAQTDASESLSRLTTAESIIEQLAEKISMLVVGTNEDGTSATLWQQTDSGFSFSLIDTQNAANDAKEGLALLKELMGSTDATLDEINKKMLEMGYTLEHIIPTKYAAGTNEDGTINYEPCLMLCENDTDFKLLITNTKVMFQVGSATPTLIDTMGMETQNLTVKNELHHGNYVWAVRPNGNYGLIYKGGN